MNQPQVVKCSELQGCSTTACVGGRWIPARHLPYYFTFPFSLINRVRLAWSVFTGRRDALDWEGQ